MRTMNTSRLFNNQDHLNQSFRSRARPIMSDQTSSAATGKQISRETGTKRHLRLVVSSMESNEEEATKTSNQPYLSAIVRMRQQANDIYEKQIISSIKTSATHLCNKMCNSPSRQADVTFRPLPKPAPPVKRSRGQTDNHSITAHTSRNCLLIGLVLVSCIMVGPIGATENEATNQAKSSQDKGSIREAIERSDSLGAALVKTALDSGNSSTNVSAQRSIVASLSSAVATAAAAAAVAAAQNGLSSTDARSSSSSSPSASSHRAPGQVNRSPGLNLAIKLVDTIPEVHYNILHNMKKLDHAAPFYNVPNKYSHGAAKESSPNFLANALTAAGAGDQISNIFRSPLWKRIADGYGDFASEFRSMFRPSAATPMRGPSSPTSKILRDISVPALLMLLASSLGSSEWRPVRTRRKSFRPVDIPAGSDILPLGGDSILSDSLISGTSQTLPPSSSGIESTMQPASAQYFQRYERFRQPQAQQQQTISSAQGQQNGVSSNFIGAGPFNGAFQPQPGAHLSQLTPRIKDDINLMAMESQRANWIAPDQVGALLSGQTDDQHPMELQAAAALGQQQQQQQQALAKRSFELNSDPSQQHSARQVEIVHGNEMQLGGDSDGSNSDSIEKLLASEQSEMVNSGYQHQFSSLFSDSNGMTPIKRGDNFEYSLITPNEIGKNEQATATKRQPALLSTMAQAAASLMRSRSTNVAKSGSLNLAASSGTNVLARLNLRPNSMIEGGIDQQIMTRRQSSPAEQRDLTKLMPETWREVVKRTVTNVQQQASVQWKSIEGQLANWVQDKLKTVGVTGNSNQASYTGPASSSQGGSSSSSSPVAGILPAPIGNMLASAGSSAMNILGLEWKNQNSSPTSATSSQSVSANDSQMKGSKLGLSEQSGSSSGGDKGKIRPSGSEMRPTGAAKVALAGVANLIGSSLSPKNAPSSPEPTSSSQTTNDQSPSSSLDHPKKSQTLGELASSVAQMAVSSIASNYPTLTGPDASLQASPSVPSGQTGSSPQLTATSTSS